MSLQKWLDFGPRWPNFSPLVAHKSHKMVVQTIILKTNRLIHSNLGVNTSWVVVPNWFTFGPHWPNFSPLVAEKWLKRVVANLHQENYSLNSLETWCVHLFGESPEMIWFGATLAKFWPAGGPKMTENGGFRPLSAKIIIQSTSVLGYTLVGYVFRTISLLGHVGPISGL